MKKIFKRGFLILMCLALMCTSVSLPGFAEGADGEFVLTRVSHEACVSAVNVSGTKNVVLTVPYNYEGETIDLNTGLDISFDTSVYDSASASFSSDAAIGGESVEMTVSYMKVGDNTIYETVYTVSVKREEYNAPAVSGSITKKLTKAEAMAFSASDFTDVYKKNDGEGLGAVSLSGSDPSFGALTFKGSDYEKGSLINISDISKLVFDASAAKASGNVTYIVSFYDGDNTEDEVGTAALKISVSISGSSTDPADTEAGVVNYSCSADEYVTFSASSFNNICKEKTGENLSYITFTLPSSSTGVLYYNYDDSKTSNTKVTASTKYYRASEKYISYVSFVPNLKFSGTATISYKAYTASNTSYTGEIKIKVSASEISGSDISYKCVSGKAVKFSATDFNNICKEEVGDNISYVQFQLPSSSYGTLYYDYTSSSNYDSKVTEAKKYYRSSTSASLNKVAFAAKAGYTGTVTINYTGYTAGGKSYTGKVKIKVSAASSSDADISYSIASDEVATFSVNDFNTVCQEETGEQLSYVKFTIPSSSYGILYYDYDEDTEDYGSKVTSSTKYYRSSKPYIKYISFVPKSTFSGTATIQYTGYNIDGDSYAGTVEIVVDDGGLSGGDINTISYSVTSGYKTISATTLRTEFNKATGETLSYVKFELPSSSYGKLVYNYSTSNRDYDALVSTSKKYYYSSTPYLKYVTFVPKSSYSGTVSVRYTGYSSGGEEASGIIKFKVTKSSSNDDTNGDMDTITYNVTNGYKTVSASDIRSKFNDATGETLSYVRFTLPSSSYGTLVYNYNSARDSYDTKVTSSTKYYYSSSPYLKYVTFVPKAGYSGTVSVKYTGYSSYGESAAGIIKFKVTSRGSDSDADIITYSVNSNGFVNFTASDFNEACQDATGSSLSYVRFALPSESDGKLYYNYRSDGTYDKAITTTTKLYRTVSSNGDLLYNTSFVPAKTNGTVIINYTGYSTDSESFSGQVRINISKVSQKGMKNFAKKRNYTYKMFNDVDENSWYGYNSNKTISEAYELGLMSGMDNGSFEPSGTLTIAQAITIASIVRSTYNDDEYDFKTSDKWYLPYVSYAVEQGIITGSEFGSFDAVATRAQVAYIFARALPSSEYTAINSVTALPDVDSFNPYKNEIFLLYNTGVLSGSDNIGTFMPDSSITRAEIASISSRLAKPEKRTKLSF